MNAISIQGVEKSYKGLQALKGVDLEIVEGEFFGLLGPNGAGKTTLIKAIVGLARLQAGNIRAFGKDVREEPIRTKVVIGLSPQEANVDRYFTVRRILQFQGGYFGFPRKETRRRADELMEQFQLTAKAEDEFWKLSGG